MVQFDEEQLQMVSPISDGKIDDQVLSLNWSNWRPCGRQEEASLLHSWYMSREQNDLVLITGPAGIGKTTLSQSLHRIVQEEAGFLIRGTFSFSAEPYEAFKTAFTSLVRQLQDRDDFDPLQSELKQAIACSGAEGFLIQDSLPILTTIMGDESSLPSGDSGAHPILDGHSRPSRISATDRQHRFVYAMTKIVEAIGSVFPLVIVLDNLMWADLGSLLLLESLCANGKLTNILIVGTCRGEEVDYKAPLATRLRSMEDRGLQLLDMPLKPLIVEDTFAIIENIQTNLNKECSWRLAEIIHECTGGVPRLILEMLEVVATQGLDSKLLHIQVGYADLVNTKVCKLSSTCQELLQVIACLGGRAVHESALVELLPDKEQSELHSAIQMAEAEGILAAGNQLGECSFFHGSIQEAIYTLIPEHVKSHIHYDIAQRLCSWFSVDQLEDNIFLVVDQYMHAGDCVLPHERVRIAQLCLGAARKASFSAAFSSAEVYVWHGIKLLDERTRWRDQYHLTLELMNVAIELEFCSGNHEGVEHLHQEILQHARCFMETITSYVTHISSLGARGNHKTEEAIAESLDVLEHLGEKLPRRLFLARTVARLVRTKNVLKKTSDEDLLRLPRLSDARIQAVTKILHVLFLHVFLQKPELVPLVSMRIIDLTLQYGLSPISKLT
jgi:predicted ATPase